MIGWILALAPVVMVERVDEGPWRGRLPASPGDLVVVAVGEQRGRLGTCACDAVPEGSLARAATWADATRAPVLRVDPGRWLDGAIVGDGSPTPRASALNAAMVEGLARGGWQALNLTGDEVPWVRVHGLPAGAVSANLAVDGLEVPAWLDLSVGGYRVAVTGVTGRPDVLEEARLTPPVEALEALLPTLPEVDLVVVLASRVDDATAIARLPGVDLLIEADDFLGHSPAVVEGEAVWVRTAPEGRRLTAVHLELGEAGPTRAVERRVRLDPAVPARADLRRLERRSRR